MRSEVSLRALTRIMRKNTLAIHAQINLTAASVLCPCVTKHTEASQQEPCITILRPTRHERGKQSI